MRRVMVRYRVKPEAVAENEALVRAVFAEIAEARPAGLRYECFVLEDGVTFVHLACYEDAGPTDFAAFRAFQAGHAGRVVEPPVVTELRSVGVYGEQTVGPSVKSRSASPLRQPRGAT
jgi:hypothetical protein